MSFIQHYSISIHFAQALINATNKVGLDKHQLLHEAGINEGLLNNPHFRITPEQYSTLMQIAWRESDDDFLGMGTQRCRHGIFSLMAKEAVRCKDLESVYHHLCRFYNLVNESIRLTLNIEGDDVALSMSLSDPKLDPDLLLREFLMLLWHRFPSWLVGQRIPLKEVRFTHKPPAHIAEYQLMFPCPTRFEQSTNTFVFSKEWLNLPVVQTRQTLKHHLRRAPLDWFTRQAFFPVYTRRVLDYLEQTDDLATSMEAIAQALHLSERTLRRKLISEGSNFQKIKDIVRRDKAIHYLSQPSIPIAQVSSLLGFSEPTAFTRAFKQWTGESPTSYRLAAKQ
ncbi:AraC family transcriptional regulator [Neptunomonas phycophila]|uniref:AraC family transcriptional regulator n=1 Tax=Neptunomonas phycophila TaxID=1572645 RepID=UPI0026E45B9B|nr:AraC family transcriptional regulator [Neptunomonas phycophila]MDO6467599.1 AraC family transcriptional regulator [Neptunomonas phycophila]